MKSLNKYINEELTNSDSYINRFAYAIANLDDSEESFLNLKIREIENKSIRGYLIDRELDLKRIENIIFGNDEYVNGMLEIITINSSTKLITGERLKTQLNSGLQSFSDMCKKLGLPENAIDLLFEVIPIEIGAGKKVGPGEYALRLLLSDYKKSGSGGEDIQTQSNNNFEVKFINTLNYGKNDKSALIFGPSKKDKYIDIYETVYERYEIYKQNNTEVKYGLPGYLNVLLTKKSLEDNERKVLAAVFDTCAKSLNDYLSNAVGEIIFIGENNKNIASNIEICYLSKDIRSTDIQNFMIANNIKFYNFNKDKISVVSNNITMNSGE